MRSSYAQNNLGELIRTYVLGTRPNRHIVELGVLDGYSTLNIAQGLKELHELYGQYSKVDAYDLFDDYQFKHGSQAEVEKMIAEFGLSDYAQVIKGDAWKVADIYANKSIEFLHVDISNTGETLRRVMEVWHPKMADKGMLLFEGGSMERDNVEWMVRYGMPSIRDEIARNETLNRCYIYGVYLQFPSMLAAMRKWWID
jgi:predicted O-methyltransferase YrrM